MTDNNDALIEQAAKALFHKEFFGQHANWDAMDERIREAWREMARAVLEAVAPAIRAQALRDAAGWPPLVDYRARGGQIEGPVCCRTCTPAYPLMLVCSTCGNKRCPHAWDHANRCTGSNEPDQTPERAEQIEEDE